MKNRKITWTLLVLVAAIWGTIAYQLYASMTEGEVNGATSNEEPKIVNKDVSITYVYLKDVRDPFKYGSSMTSDSTRKPGHTATNTVWVPPPLRLTGILAAGKRKTVMLQTTDGAVHFLKVGDTLRGVKVLEIGVQEVGYAYQRKYGSWTLSRTQ